MRLRVQLWEWVKINKREEKDSKRAKNCAINEDKWQGRDWVAICLWIWDERESSKNFNALGENDEFCYRTIPLSNSPFVENLAC